MPVGSRNMRNSASGEIISRSVADWVLVSALAATTKGGGSTRSRPTFMWPGESNSSSSISPSRVTL